MALSLCTADWDRPGPRVCPCAACMLRCPALHSRRTPVQQQQVVHASPQPAPLDLITLSLEVHAPPATLALPRAEWEIEPKDIEICKRADGSEWLLGEGPRGKVYKALKGGVQVRRWRSRPGRPLHVRW